MSAPAMAIELIRSSGPRPVSLATEAVGEGDTLVWAHALLASMAVDSAAGVLDWHELADEYRILRYDARGHGQSGITGEAEDFAWDALSDNLWDVVDHYTAGPVVLGGASMGCATSLHAACQRPERVRGLVLVIPPTAWELRDAMRSNYRRTARVVEFSRGIPFKLLKHLPAQGRERGFRKYSQSFLLSQLAQSDYRGVASAMRGAALSDLPAPEQLAALEMPALVLAWQNDDIHPEAIARRLADTLPRAELVIGQDEQAPYGWPEKVREFMRGLA